MKKIIELENIDKPRERLLKKGAKALKEYELFAVIFASGTKNKDVLVLSKEVTKLINNDIKNLNYENLIKIKGLGKAKIATLLSSYELFSRYLTPHEAKITKASDVYTELQEYKNKQQEYFILITLNGANEIIKKRVISIGLLNQALVHPREVFSPALEDRANSIIIAHNHPSGVLKASREDINITSRLKECGVLLGIELLDHIIITKNGFLSFKDEELL